MLRELVIQVPRRVAAGMKIRLGRRGVARAYQISDGERKRDSRTNLAPKNFPSYAADESNLSDTGDAARNSSRSGPHPHSANTEVSVSMKQISALCAAATMLSAGIVAAHGFSGKQKPHDVQTESAVFSDYTTERPGVFHKITAADLPAPSRKENVHNPPRIVPRPEGAWPQVPPGFQVQLYATGGFAQPRLMRTAPNGDVFLADSKAGVIRLLRGLKPDGKAEMVVEYASGLNRPFGIAFYPPGENPRYVYVGNTDSVVRFPYKNGDLKATASAETVVPNLPSGAEAVGGGGHWTRDVVFSRDSKKMYVSVGSRSNVDDTDGNSSEFHRADVLEFNPDGSGLRVFAWGLRNCVGEAIQPETGRPVVLDKRARRNRRQLAA